MRPGPNNRRMRSRGNNNRRGPSKNQSYDSSGPESRVRGNAQQLVDKYLQLSRDALTSGEFITAENFSQHAEHYYRIHSAATEQRQASRPQGQNRGGNGPGNAADGKNGAATATATGNDTSAGNDASTKAGNGKDVDAAATPQPDLATGAESGEPKTA